MSTDFIDSDNKNVEARIDDITEVLSVIDYAHHEKHSGSDFFLVYSVVSLGALLAPDDTMTLTFTTPNTTKWGHFTFRVTGTGGWRVRLIEAPTGGGITPTGSLTLLNSNRNSSTTSTFLDVAAAPVAGKVSYGATLATGGTTLIDEYIHGDKFIAGAANHDEEIILKQNTAYQVSLYGIETDPATIRIGFYEHTNR